MKKIILIWIIATILLVTFVQAGLNPYTVDVTTFTNGQDSEDFNIKLKERGQQEFVRYINLSIYASLTADDNRSALINLSISNSSSTNSTIENSTIQINDTLSDNTPSLTYDGDWSTSISAGLGARTRINETYVIKKALVSTVNFVNLTYRGKDAVGGTTQFDAYMFNSTSSSWVVIDTIPDNSITTETKELNITYFMENSTHYILNTSFVFNHTGSGDSRYYESNLTIGQSSYYHEISDNFTTTVTAANNNSVFSFLDSLRDTFNNGTCECTGCFKDTGYCRIPTTFFSYNPGTFTYKDLNINYDLGVSSCTHAQSLPTINFTVIDEQTGTLLNNISDLDITLSWYQDDSSNSASDTFQFNNNDDNSLCIVSEKAILSSTYSVTATATGYQQRIVSESDITINNVTRNVTISLLQTTEGIFVRFNTKDSFENNLIGVTVVMTLEENDTVLDSQITDDSGIATFFADVNTDYNFTFTFTGYTTTTVNLRPTSTDVITVIMPSETTTSTPVDGAGILYDFYPKESPLSNSTDYDFSFNLSSSYWNITNCTFYLKHLNDTIIDASSSGFNGSLCDITLSFNTGNFTGITVEALYELNYTTNITQSRRYDIRDDSEGSLSLKNFLDDLSSFSGAGFNSFTLAIIAFVIIFGIVAYVSNVLEIRVTINPEILLILLLVLVWVFSYVGWLTTNFTGIPSIINGDHLNKYMAFYLLFIFTLGVIIQRLR